MGDELFCNWNPLREDVVVIADCGIISSWYLGMEQVVCDVELESLLSKQKCAHLVNTSNKFIHFFWRNQTEMESYAWSVYRISVCLPLPTQGAQEVLISDILF